MTAKYDPALCERLEIWARSFVSEPGTATDPRVILVREAVRDVLSPTLCALADQLSAARAEIDRVTEEHARWCAELGAGWHEGSQEAEMARVIHERDALQRKLEAAATIEAASQRTIESGNKALTQLRAEWHADRDVLRNQRDSYAEMHKSAEREAEAMQAVVDTAIAEHGTLEQRGPHDRCQLCFVVHAYRARKP